MPRKAIHTDAAPAALGTYSQAVQSGDTVYFSGQIGINPETQTLVTENFDAEVSQVFENISAVASAAGGSLDKIVRLTVYLTDLGNFATVSDVMARYFDAPYPARAALGVAALPKGATVEIDAIMVLA